MKSEAFPSIVVSIRLSVIYKNSLSAFPPALLIVKFYLSTPVFHTLSLFSPAPKLHAFSGRETPGEDVEKRPELRTFAGKLKDRKQ